MVRGSDATLVLLLVFSGCLWSACRRDCLVDGYFFFGALEHFKIKDERFCRVSREKGCSSPFYFCRIDMSVDDIVRLWEDIEGHKSGDRNYYHCRAVLAEEVSRAHKKPVTVHNLWMLTVGHEVSVCTDMCRTLWWNSTYAARRDSTRFCTSFRGARSVMHIARDQGMELFVGRYVGHPDYNEAELSNDFQGCFRDIPGQSWPDTWVFIAGSSATCQDAGEFLHQWLDVVKRRGKTSAQVAFYFAFEEKRAYVQSALRTHILSCCLDAGMVKKHQSFFEEDSRGWSALYALKDLDHIAQKHVQKVVVQEPYSKDREVILPDNAASVFAGKVPTKEVLQSLQRLTRVDVLVGSPPGLCGVSCASYVTQAYRVFWEIRDFYARERKIGYIDGRESSMPLTDKWGRGANSECALVYVAGDGRYQDIVAHWAQTVCTKFGYKTALPIECGQWSVGQYLLIAC